jgi:hypothetical protein
MPPLIFLVSHYLFRGYDPSPFHLRPPPGGVSRPSAQTLNTSTPRRVHTILGIDEGVAFPFPLMMKMDFIGVTPIAMMTRPPNGPC